MTWWSEPQKHALMGLWDLFPTIYAAVPVFEDQILCLSPESSYVMKPLVVILWIWQLKSWITLLFRQTPKEKPLSWMQRADNDGAPSLVFKASRQRHQDTIQHIQKCEWSSGDLSFCWNTFVFSNVNIQGQFAFADKSEWAQMLDGVNDTFEHTSGQWLRSLW